MLTTKAIVAENNLITFKEIPCPELKEGQVRIRNICSLISPGTELYYAKAKSNSGPILLGYCSSGYVESLGEGVTGLSVGDRVIAMGLNYAIHAEKICVPYRLCVKIPDELTFEKAVFANLLATAVHAVDRSLLKPYEKVLVVGAGLLGQLIAQCAHIYTPYVYISDFSKTRLKIAEKSGLKAIYPEDGSWCEPLLRAVNRTGVDKIFLCISGEGTQAFSDALSVLSSAPDGARRGRIICVGRVDARINFSVEMGNTDIIYSARCGLGYKDTEYEHGRTNYEMGTGEVTVTQKLEQSLQLIVTNKVNMNYIHTHRVVLDEAMEAYKMLGHQDHAIGITIHYRNLMEK